MFSPKIPKRGSVNSVCMRFYITIFPGRLSDFRLGGGGVTTPPPKGLGGGVTTPLLPHPIPTYDYFRPDPFPAPLPFLGSPDYLVFILDSLPH